MTLEIVVSRKVGGAVWTFVSLGGRRLGRILTVTWKTHLTGWSTWILQWHWTRKGKCPIAGVVSWVRRNQLVMRLVLMLVLLLWLLLLLLWRLLRHAFLCGIPNRAGHHIDGRSTLCGCCITVTKTRKAYRACVHGISGDSGLLWYHEGGFCCLVALGGHWRKRRRCIGWAAHGLTVVRS